jgi:polyphosphate kinase
MPAESLIGPTRLPVGAADSSANSSAGRFLDRDESWLEFNRRVLHEAIDPRTPLLERLKFLAIFSSNLDEFFMKRIGPLRQEMLEQPATADTSEAHRRLLAVRETLLPMLERQADLFSRVLRPELAGHNIHLLGWQELNDAQRRFAQEFFHRNVFPVLTPLAVDPGHPFPFISNLSTSLGILLRGPDASESFFARVKVPDVFPQWLALPVDGAGDGSARRACFVQLLDVIRQNLGELFPGMTIVEVMPFRITRNAEVETDDSDPTESVAAHVAEELRQRRFEPPVRLEYGMPASASQLQLLLRKLKLSEADAYAMPGELDFTDLFALAGLDRPELRDPPWQPLVPPAFADPEADVFAAVRSGDILVHHPYESFDDTVARFIRAAAHDPKVLALKMTAYRVGAHTPFLDTLVHAAEFGKQVACLVEVTARFDERQNLQVAQALEKAGVHVVYGIVGLKTHCKTTLVVRQDDDGLRCYAHIGTGNYNVKTALLYTDLGLFTCDPVLTQDVVNLFHFLTGHSLKRDYAALLVAPVNMRERFLQWIEREVEHARAGRPAQILAKMNQLEDREVCEALLRASQAGVRIDLIVRGFCVLRPGVPGESDNIAVISVIGRFLEHSRIFWFRNGQEDPLAGDYFIGSADWMHRNLSDRVEAVTPIQATSLRRRLWEILQMMLQDHRFAWELRRDGSYVQRQPPADGKPGPANLGAQQALMIETKLADG